MNEFCWCLSTNKIVDVAKLYCTLHVYASSTSAYMAHFLDIGTNIVTRNATVLGKQT